MPAPRGELTHALTGVLTGRPGAALPPPGAGAAADPYGEDTQLALYLCYELHYRPPAGVDPEWEWSPRLLEFRRELERAFLDALRADTPGRRDVDGLFDTLLAEPVDGASVSHHLKDHGRWAELREYFAHRSVYHLKEADPHAWVIPRLTGGPKAALVAVEFDEYGGGHADRMHQRLFADLLRGAGLVPDYLHYLDRVPAEMLAIVNMMSLFGLHRGLRGALVGHFAAAEITSPPSARRLAAALERVDAPPECVVFYTEHIEADAVHEQVMRHDVVGGLLAAEPELRADVVLGIEATGLLETRFERRLLDAWNAGRTSLLAPLAG